MKLLSLHETNFEKIDLKIFSSCNKDHVGVYCLVEPLYKNLVD